VDQLNEALYEMKDMDKIEELNIMLTDSAEVLVECCTILRDEPIDPKEKNIYRLGKAIFEINEIREQIYKIHPQLQPEKWGLPPTEEDIEDMYEVACTLSKEHIDSGNIAKAIETFESFIFIGQPNKYEEKAKNEIIKIKQNHNV